VVARKRVSAGARNRSLQRSNCTMPGRYVRAIGDEGKSL
jgi:hypothetical protein